MRELLAANHEQIKDAVAPHIDAVAAASAELAKLSTTSPA